MLYEVITDIGFPRHAAAGAAAAAVLEDVQPFARQHPLPARPLVAVSRSGKLQAVDHLARERAGG